MKGWRRCTSRVAKKRPESTAIRTRTTEPAKSDSPRAALPTFEALTTHDDEPVLPFRPRHKLRPGPLPLLLPARARAAAEVLWHFKANADKDPTGYKTLEEVVGTTDMPAFQKKWETYVMKIGATRLGPKGDAVPSAFIFSTNRVQFQSPDHFDFLMPL